MRPFTIIVKYEATHHPECDLTTYAFCASSPEFDVEAVGRSSRDAVINLLNIITDRGIDALRSLTGEKS